MRSLPRSKWQLLVLTPVFKISLLCDFIHLCFNTLMTDFYKLIHEKASVGVSQPGGVSSVDVCLEEVLSSYN